MLVELPGEKDYRVNKVVSSNDNDLKSHLTALSQLVQNTKNQLLEHLNAPERTEDEVESLPKRLKSEEVQQIDQED